MNDSVFVAVSRGTGNPNRSTRAIHFPSPVRRQGRENTFPSVGKCIWPAQKNKAARLRDIAGEITPGFLNHLKEFRIPIMNSRSATNRRLAKANNPSVEIWPVAAQSLTGIGRSSTMGIM